MTALTEIEELALEVAKAARQPNTPLEQRLDALKILEPYYKLLTKDRGKPDEDGDTTMSALRGAMTQADEGHHNGATALRDRRRREQAGGS